ncbi:MAG: hypothetical protein K2O89_03265 [Clostridia bacterium]|nr:hypothetical protein [Clostridia bacterium]
MWNSQEPLKLLLSMPTHLTSENVQNLQAVIDVDKIVNSQRLKRDLCGEYAPFCDFCDKTVRFPCAHAYVKMKHAEGLDVEVPEDVYNSLKLESEVVAEVATAEEEVAEETEEVEEVEEVVEEPKKRIRIAIAKKTR